MGMHKEGSRKVIVFPRFERAWHWTQAGLIFLLLFTGLGLNGLHGLLSFELAVTLHTGAAMVLLLIWIFATFWLFTTGTWKHFIPKFQGMFAVAKFYAWDVFHGKDHPYEKVIWRKHNPLQAITYFVVKMAIFPLIWVTGIIYLTYNFWEGIPNASLYILIIANLHLWSAYVTMAFVIVHVYLLTVGHGFRAHVKPMITGYDDVHLTPEQEAYLEDNEPWRLKAEES